MTPMKDYEEKIFFGITKVTGSLRSKHRYREKDLYADEPTDQSGEHKLEKSQASGLVYDFRGIYPSKPPPERESQSEEEPRYRRNDCPRAPR